MKRTIKERIINHFTTELGIHPDDLEELLAVTRSSLQDGLNTLHRALAGRDGETAVRFAHTLKGNLKNLGLTDLSEQARTIESDAGDGSWNGLSSRLDELEAKLAEILAEP